jgi:hypothetical protein
MASGRHWRNNQSSKMTIQFIWRDDHTRTGLTNLASSRGIQLNKTYVATPDRSLTAISNPLAQIAWTSVGRSDDLHLVRTLNGLHRPSLGEDV